jgi:hypothetical protein
VERDKFVLRPEPPTGPKGTLLRATFALPEVQVLLRAGHPPARGPSDLPERFPGPSADFFAPDMAGYSCSISGARLRSNGNEPLPRSDRLDRAW